MKLSARALFGKQKKKTVAWQLRDVKLLVLCMLITSSILYILFKRYHHVSAGGEHVLYCGNAKIQSNTLRALNSAQTSRRFLYNIPYPGGRHHLPVAPVIPLHTCVRMQCWVHGS